jgi:hypothetical protein
VRANQETIVIMSIGGSDLDKYGYPSAFAQSRSGFRTNNCLEPYNNFAHVVRYPRIRFESYVTRHASCS